MQVAVHALDGEAVFGDRVAMRATRDEENVVPVRRQPRAEIAADRSRRHCRNTHKSSNVGGTFAQRQAKIKSAGTGRWGLA